MKTFKTLFEEVNKQTEEEKDLSVDDAGLIKVVTERLGEIVSAAAEMTPEETVEELKMAMAVFNLKFDEKKALAALQSDELVELTLTVADSEDDPFVLSAEDEETGEEIPGEMVLAVHKDGEGIYAKVHVYFDDEKPEVLDDLKFHIPDEEEPEEEKEKEQEEGNLEDYPADEEDSSYTEKTDGETREVGGRVNQLGGVEEDDDEEEEECTCDDKENCTCGAKKKKETDGIDGGEHQASLSSGGSEVTRKGAIEVYEEYTGGTKYVVIHVKNNKLRADIIDHKLDAYNQGLNIVGDLIEVTPKDIHDTESRMRELSKLKRKKVADAKKKLAAREEAKKIIADAKEAEKPEEKQEESLPASNTQVVKKLKEKKGKDLPQPGIHQI
jgi:hypothetical protein